MPENTVGYWVGKGAPAVVDWCEPNYVVTPFVAEFWNTMTSFPMLVLGLVGVWHVLRSGGRVLPRFALCFAGLGTVGFGSVLFHGTLLRIPQALDELPMVYAILAASWVLLHRKSAPGEGRATAIAMLLYAVAFTVVYAVAESYFILFLISWGAFVTFVALRSIWLTRQNASDQSPLRALSWASAGGFLTAFFVAWLPEHVFLACDHWLQAYHLHSWWHLGSGGGVYAWILWAVADRYHVEGVATRWRGSWVEPANG